MVGALTLIGLALRWHDFTQSLIGDELSTLWIVLNNDLIDTVRLVKTDAEITPPLYFVLAWFATRLGDSPELVRLPALLAGVASIPLMYELGKRTAGQGAGLVAAAIFALSPAMVYFSANGRSYSLLTFLLICSTLTMLLALKTGRIAWWLGFAAATCLAMYSHYTAAFVLAGQLGWLLWAHPEARRAALLATAAAAAAFLPWIAGLLADLSSPTTKILAILQGSGFHTKLIAFETWAFGRPLIDTSKVPGHAWVLVICSGLAIALIATLVTRLTRAGGFRAALRGLPKEYVLIAVIALATPVCELILIPLGTDLLGARNLTASSYGLYLAFGAIVASAGVLWGVVSAILVIGGFAVGAGKVTQAGAGTPDFKAAADFIERQSSPDDVVIDGFGAGLSPVPLAPMDFYLRDGQPLYHLNRPSSPPPYLPFATVLPSQDKLLRRAFRQAGSRPLFLVKPDVLAIGSVDDPGNEGLNPSQPAYGDREIILPRGARITETKRFPSDNPPSVLVIRNSGPAP